MNLTKSYTKAELQDYQAQVSSNEDTFKRMLKTLRPDMWMLYDVYESVKGNPLVMVRVLRQMHNIAMGTGYGQVTILIEGGVVRFVRGEESDKLNEPVVFDTTGNQSPRI